MKKNYVLLVLVEVPEGPESEKNFLEDVGLESGFEMWNALDYGRSWKNQMMELRGV